MGTSHASRVTIIEKPIIALMHSIEGSVMGEDASRNNGQLSKQIMVPNRIKNLLEDGSKRTLTLLVAMGGYGKTSCVSAFAEKLQTKKRWAVAWLSLSPLDNAPVRFWQTFLQSLQNSDPNLHELKSFGDDHDSLSSSDEYVWIHDFLAIIGRQKKDYYVVVDDAHFLTDKAILEPLNHVLHFAPDNLHFALMCRHDPELSLYKLRIAENITELRIEDLSFTYPETEEFFKRKRSKGITKQDIEDIYHVTRGWVAGLQMVDLLLKKERSPRSMIKNFPKNNTWLMNFLIEEVLHAMSEETKNFLLSTCFLPYATLDTFECVTKKTNCTKLISELLDMNLLMKANPGDTDDVQSQWYTYHPLFSESLKHCMKLEYSTERMSELYEIAFAWYESAELYYHAISLAIESGHFSDALRLITSHLSSVLIKVESHVLMQWLESISHPEEYDEYHFALVHAWAHFIAAKTERSIYWLDRARIAKSKLDAKSIPETSERIFETVEIGTLVFIGDYEEALQLGNETLSMLTGQELFLRGTIMHILGEAWERLGNFDEASEHFIRAKSSAERSGRLIVGAMCSYELGWIQFVKGNLENASNYYLREINVCRNGGRTDSWALGMLYIGIARIYFHWGDTDKTGYYLDQAVLVLTHHVNTDAYIESQVVICELQIKLGHLDNALDTIIAAYELMETNLPPRGVNILVPLTLAKVYTRSEQYERAQRLLDETKEELHQQDIYSHVLWNIRQTHLYLVLEEYEEALYQAELALSRARTGDLGILVQESQVYIACIRKHLDDHDGAKSILVEALTSAKPENHVQIFLEELPGLDLLLNEIAFASNGNKIHSVDMREAKEFAATVLSSQENTRGTLMGGQAKPETTQSFSRREKEIYDLLKQGKTRKEIAETLGIRVNTVRTHMSNIYKKTGVHNKALLE